MHFSCPIQSIPVQQWMKLIISYQLHIGMHPEDHVVPHTSSQETKSFLFFTDTYQSQCSHVKPTNNGPYSLKQLPRSLEIQSYSYLMIFRKIAVSHPDLISNQHLQFHLSFLQQSRTLWLVINHSYCLTLKMSCNNM